MQKKAITQNSQYTFKYNSSLGRHGWLRLTPAYSVRLVEEILADLNYNPRCVMEPFSGTGTTELVCANKGIPSFALEINPFLVWLGNAKLDIYPPNKVEEFLSVANVLMQNIEEYTPTELPPIYNIYRWWNPPQADFLARLKSAIKTVKDGIVVQLLTVAFCRVIIELSNAAFNHVSTSFKDDNNVSFSIEIAKETFISICKMVADGALLQPCAASKVILNDSRSVPIEYMGKYDTVITSPPYPNRISYIRELRPYMYWLDYLETSEQASDLDWKAIGGTWGKATSLLGTWKSNHLLPQYVYDIARKIANADNKSAGLMANYVLKYFEDMHSHLASVYAGLATNGEAFYIIGNSNFYGITVPAEKIYLDMMEEIGFTNVEYHIVRKRNCNKQLYEFVVSGQKA
mgnify:FL=1